MAAHMHQDFIVAWAGGARIQSRMKLFNEEMSEWEDIENPSWLKDYEYRIKPAEPERSYPKIQITDEEVKVVMTRLYARDTTLTEDRRELMNEGVRVAIDAGQVVTREEFDRMCGDRKARDMAVAKAVLASIDKGLRENYQMYGVAEGYMKGWNLSAIIAEVKQ